MCKKYEFIELTEKECVNVFGGKEGDGAEIAGIIVGGIVAILLAPIATPYKAVQKILELI